MSSRSHLDWPFFEDRHRKLAANVARWAADHIDETHGDDVDSACRDLVRKLGDAGWLKYCIGSLAHGTVGDVIDTRGICVIREILARRSGLADFAFAMQGLG